MSLCCYFLNLLRDYEGRNVNTPITDEDKILIKNLFVLKGYNAKQLEFPSKGWNVDSIYKLLQKLPITGSVDHRPAAADDTAQHS